MSAETVLPRPPESSAPKQILLIGAGHAHLLAVQQAWKFRELGVRVILVEPGSFWYSGTATGILGGELELRDGTVPPEEFRRTPDLTLREDRLVGIDCAARRARLASGAELEYELISFNVGSTVRLDDIPGALEHARPAKPVSRLWDLRLMLEERAAEGLRSMRALVVGGGATGCEITGNLKALARRLDLDLQVGLATGGSRLLEGHPAGAARWLQRDFTRRGVSLEFGFRLARLEAGCALAAAGRRIECDVVVMATGLRPPALMQELGLPLDAQGGLQVDASLRSPADPRVFAVGDCAGLLGHRLPKLGVYSVRQAPVLVRNMLAHFGRARLQQFRPQRRCLSILNLGCSGALAVWGPLWLRGGLARAWKQRLDRGFLARIRGAPRS